MKRMLTIAMVLCAGCGPDAAKNFGAVTPITKVKYSRGAFGASMEFTNTKNVDAMLSGVKINKETGDLEIGMFTVKDNASDVMGANIPQMQQVAAMYPLYTALQAQYGANTVAIMGAIPPIITSATPLLGPWLNSLGQAKLAAASRPGVVLQLAELVKSGAANLDLIGNVFKGIDPNLVKDVQSALGSQPLETKN